MPTTLIPPDDVHILDAPYEVLSTMTKEGERKWMYPTPSKGRYYKWRFWTAWALIVFFVALPIVQIGGKPAVLLDLAAREFTFFGATFYPTDTFLLMLLMIGGLLSVFLLTALLGRVWCGWGCPQTVYLEFVYRPVERLIEGKEHKRKRRDEGPWTWDKAWRKGLKLFVYIVISAALAHTFVAYFVGWERLLGWMMEGTPRQHAGYFVLMAGTTGLMVFNFGYFREQMCTIACPYARLQSVLVDADSMVVAYDPGYGEPRGRGKDRTDKGACVDCFACVRTCPTGIDIRDGLQMECVACTQCIDACDDIMDKTGQERGLIRYTSENELAGKTTRWLRPRTVLYTLFLAAITTVFTVALTTRDAYDINVARAAAAPFMELPDGRIANRLRFRVRNQTATPTQFSIEVADPTSAEVRVVGVQPVPVAPEEMERVEAWIVVEPEVLTGGRYDATFRLAFENGVDEEVPFVLLGPTE